VHLHKAVVNDDPLSNLTKRGAQKIQLNSLLYSYTTKTRTTQYMQYIFNKR